VAEYVFTNLESFGFTGSLLVGVDLVSILNVGPLDWVGGVFWLDGLDGFDRLTDCTDLGTLGGPIGLDWPVELCWPGGQQTTGDDPTNEQICGLILFWISAITVGQFWIFRQMWLEEPPSPSRQTASTHKNIHYVNGNRLLYTFVNLI